MEFAFTSGITLGASVFTSGAARWSVYKCPLENNNDKCLGMNQNRSEQIEGISMCETIVLIMMTCHISTDSYDS